MLPKMKYTSGIRKQMTVEFGGLDRRDPDRDGRIWNMRNLGSERFPLLRPRNRRWFVKPDKLERPNGIYGRDGLFYVDGDAFYANGIKVCSVEDSRKQFAAMGSKIIIFPDKICYDTVTGQITAMEAAHEAECVIRDGTIFGEEADANTIYCEGEDWQELGFRAGDALTISGAKIPGNNQTLIVREVDGPELRFYENSFVVAEGGDRERLRIERTVPDLEFVFECENRLWGCSGDTVCCSKLGDPTNWNVFDGLSTDAWAAQVGSGGGFTAACSYRGYPIFFKEEQIFKIYGEKVSTYQVVESASMGVERGSGKSIAVAGEIMFYLSRTGFVAYSGGMPRSIHAPFGNRRFQNAVAGSDGVKYYVSAQSQDDGYELWVYDTRNGCWHMEDETQAVGWAWNQELYCLDAEGTVWMNGDARTVPPTATREGPVEAMAEFGDFTAGHPNRKGTGKLQLRAELGEGAELRMHMQFDGGEWMEAACIKNSTGKRSYYIPIIPRRSDHYRIRFNGNGEWTINSLVREEYTGSPGG